MGICLGAQLLAKAAGAKVKKDSRGEIGFFNVEFTKKSHDDPLFSGLGKSMKVFQWHNDSFNIPEGGVLLAEAKECKNQAFKVGGCAYGLQFHIESTPEMIKKWLYNNLSGNNFNKRKMAKGIISKPR